MWIGGSSRVSMAQMGVPVMPCRSAQGWGARRREAPERGAPPWSGRGGAAFKPVKESPHETRELSVWSVG